MSCNNISFNESKNNYIITIDGISHSIPKCGYGYKDCYDEYIDACTQGIVTCSDLISRGYQTVSGDLHVRSLSFNNNKITLKQGTVSEDKQTFTIDVQSLDSSVSALALNSSNVLTLSQDQNKPTRTVDLSKLDSSVTGLSINSSNVLSLTQDQNKPTRTVDLSRLDSYLSGVSLNGTTLTFTQTQNKPSLSVNLSSIIPADKVFDSSDFGGNGTSSSPYNIKWDQICSEAENVSSPDGYNVLLCGSGGVKKVNSSTFAQELCFNDIPDLGSVCGTSYSLVLYEDGDCTKLAKVSDSTEGNFYGGPWQVLDKTANTGGYNLPADFPTANLFYSTSNYITAGGNDSSPYNNGQYGSNVRTASGLSNTRITNSRICHIEGDIDCTTLYEVSVSTIIRRPSTVALAYTRQWTFGRRIRYSQDNGSTWTPWLYWKNNGSTGDLGIITVHSSLNSSDTLDFSDTRIYAGKFQLEVFYLAPDDTDTDYFAILGANTYNMSTGNPAPKVSIVRKY